ncbi:MAG: hypothetical protein AAF736_04195 [Pseudomonadota bacterium]
MSTESAIRYAQDPDNPTLLYTYLDDCDQRAALASTIQAQRIYRHAFELLLDVISDDCVPRHWRALCLDHVYRTLVGLARLAESDRDLQGLLELESQLRVTAEFFLGKAQVCGSLPARGAVASA